jgi:prephenate dehydrogenase
VEGADVVVVCTPVLAIPELVERCLPRLKAGCVVTDVGSTKAYLHERLDPMMTGRGVEFVGSHPIAGSDRDGLEAARADLYEGATVVVTAGGGEGAAPSPAAEVVAGFWRGLGGRVIETTAGEHDAIMARTSHLPHLAAALVALCVGRGGERALGRFCGTGFRDTTRVAGGEPGMWHDIVKTNAGPLAAEVRELRDRAAALLESIERGRFDVVRDLLAEARDARRRALEDGP